MFLLAYFRTPAEALHYGLSKDGLHWHALNNNQPVLQGEVGTHTLRDPFVFQAQDGRYHLLATNGWKSDSIVHATSGNLIDWTPQRLVPVMQGVEHVRNCWAPECFYDEAEKLYRLIWSSTTVPREVSEYDHRIWSCTTEDFGSFSPPHLFFDPGYNVIDATVLKHEGHYLMAFKDERGENRHGTDFKAMRLAQSTSGAGPWTAISELVTPTLTEGPSLYRIGSTLYMLYDHFMDGHFGIAHSEDGTNWKVIEDPLSFPEHVRHAAVLEIEEEVGEKLRATLMRTRPR
jgi:beta-xylosidase